MRSSFFFRLAKTFNIFDLCLFRKGSYSANVALIYQKTFICSVYLWMCANEKFMMQTENISLFLPLNSALLTMVAYFLLLVLLYYYFVLLSFWLVQVLM